jgi:uncharacterized protein
MERGNGPAKTAAAVAIQFEWDERKAKSNLLNHGVSFPDVCAAFYDPVRITTYDDRFEEAEARYFLLGEMLNSTLVAVAYAERDGMIRIISARKAGAKERWRYHEEKRRFQ